LGDLPTTNNGLLILREDGELVSSHDIPDDAQFPSAMFDEPLDADAMPAVEVSLTDDLALPTPPPLRPASLPPRLPSLRPVAAAPEPLPVEPKLPEPYRPVFTDRPSAPPQVIMGSPIMGVPIAAGAAPRVSGQPIGRTVSESGLKPMSTRVVGVPVPSTDDVLEAPSTPRRVPSVRKGPIKERDRRGPGEIESALPNVQSGSSSGASKAEALFLQALTDHQMGNDVAAENGIKLALTYSPGDPRYQDALRRLKSGQILVD
jgi:hypothetical protein